MLAATARLPAAQIIVLRPGVPLEWLRDLLIFPGLMALSFAIAFTVISAAFSLTLQRSDVEVMYQPDFNTKSTALYSNAAIERSGSFYALRGELIEDVAGTR